MVRPAATQPVDDLGHHGPGGHSKVIDSGGTAHGVVTTLAPPPGKGACSDLTLAPSSPFLVDQQIGHEHSHHHTLHSNWALPKLDFPLFEGENPQFWKTKCEKYFAVYGVQPDLWVRVATLHFSCTAARWLQVQEAHNTPFTWETLCMALCAKFGREQYQLQLR